MSDKLQAERERFEQLWLSGEIDRISRSGILLQDFNAHMAWSGYQAALSSSQQVREEPSSVAMTDAHEIWAAAQLLPGEGIEDGVQRIENILQSPPKGATCICGEPESKGITHRTDGPCYVTEEASKPQDEREAVLNEVADAIRESRLDQRDMFAQLVLSLKSQPSAASGRELPPLPAQAAAWIIPGDDGGSMKEWLDARQWEAGEFTAPLFNARQMHAYALAALTGAAPADANAGDALKKIQQHLQVMLASANQLGDDDDVTGYQIKTGALHQILGVMAGAGFPVTVPLYPGSRPLNEEEKAALEDFRKAMNEEAIPAIVETMRRRAQTAAEIDHVPLSTAPEPSAPADKVDMPALREAVSDAAYEWQKDVDEDHAPISCHKHIERAFDAAIDRMRSESGKGDK